MNTRRPIIAGNWKMYLTRDSSVALASELVQGVGATADVDMVVCPSFVYLDIVSSIVSHSTIKLGAQNLSYAPNGPYTGEISATMLVDLGCEYVIVGHSERRVLFGETDYDVNRKVIAALNAALVPIVCVGETLEQRQQGKTKSVLNDQCERCFAGLSTRQMCNVVIAYEPAWVLGTEATIIAGEADDAHRYLRETIQAQSGTAAAKSVRIVFGGKLCPSNAVELMSHGNTDGVLLGSASLDAESFLAIVSAARPC